MFSVGAIDITTLAVPFYLYVLFLLLEAATGYTVSNVGEGSLKQLPGGR